MPSAETNPSRLRFPRAAGFVFAITLAIASPLFAADPAVERPLDEGETALAEAANLLKMADGEKDRAARDRALAQAQEKLEKLIKYPPGGFDTSHASALLGKVHIHAGRAAMADARAVANADVREALTKQARERFHAADPHFKKAFEDITSLFGWHLHPPFVPPNDPRALRRERQKGTLIQSATGRAEVLEELAGTYPAGSPEARQHYEEAAERYGMVYKEYRTLIAGVVARMKQGECHFRLGNAPRAQELYDELVSWPDDLKPLRPYRAKAMALRLECRNSEYEKAHVRAFSEGEEYLAHLPREEASWEQWQAIRYETARGYMLAAATRRTDGTASPERAVWLAKADAHAVRLLEHATPLTEQSGRYRTVAESLRREIAKIGTVGGNGTK